MTNPEPHLDAEGYEAMRKWLEDGIASENIEMARHNTPQMVKYGHSCYIVQAELTLKRLAFYATSRPSDAELIVWGLGTSWKEKYAVSLELFDDEFRFFEKCSPRLITDWKIKDPMPSEARAIIEPEYLKWKQEQGK